MYLVLTSHFVRNIQQLARSFRRIDSSEKPHFDGFSLGIRQTRRSVFDRGAYFGNGLLRQKLRFGRGFFGCNHLGQKRSIVADGFVQVGDANLPHPFRSSRISDDRIRRKSRVDRAAKPLREICGEGALLRIVEFDRTKKSNSPLLKKLVQVGAGDLRHGSKFLEDEPFVDEHDEFERASFLAFGADDEGGDLVFGKLPMSALQGLRSHRKELGKRNFDRSGFGGHAERMLAFRKRDDAARCSSPRRPVSSQVRKVGSGVIGPLAPSKGTTPNPQKVVLDEP